MPSGLANRWAAVAGLWLAGMAAVVGTASLAATSATGDTSTRTAAAPAVHYRFRQPPRDGLLKPTADLLGPGERNFLATLPVVRVGLNLPDNRPYEVIDADGQIGGIQVEILTHVAQALGIRLQPVVLNSFPETLTALRERRIDMMTTVGYEPAREAYLRYTLGTAPNPGVVIGRDADQRFNVLPTLNGRRVALERGYVTRFYVNRLYPDALVTDHDDTAAALRAVALGEDDYYFGSLLMATDRIQRDHITGLAVKRSLVYATGQMHFGVRSDWPLLASALSRGVAALRDTPMPQLRSALQALGPDAGAVPLPLALRPDEQRQMASRSVLRVGAVRGLALLNEVLPSGAHSGIASDYTAQVAARLGLAIDVVPFDTVAEMLDALRDGSIHLVPFLSRTPEREKAFVFSQPYLEMPYLIVARSDAPLYWDLDSLRGKRLALALQHPLRELLRERYPDIRIVDARHGDEAMDMVVDRRADAAVEVKLFAHLRINNDTGGRLREVARVEELPAQFHFALARPLAMLAPMVDRALADIAPDERERLLRRWVAMDLAPGFPWRRHLPWLAAAATALLLLGLVSAGWMRRLSQEVRQRRVAEQRLRDVANSLPGVVFEYVSGQAVPMQAHYFNDKVSAFLGPGFTAKPDLLEALLEHSTPEEAQRVRAARQHSLRTLAPFKQTLRCNDAAAGPRWLHCEAVARRLDGGRTAWTGFLVDVSGERALQAQLLDTVQAKNLFVASASHELRAPLQVITLAIHRLGAGALDTAQRQVWRMAQDACDALLMLVDDVLDYTRMDAGRLRLQPTRVALRQLLAQIVEQHRLAADRQGLALHLVLADDLPDTAVLDGLRLRQVLANVVGNAIKYTPLGQVDVGATLADGGSQLQLVVRDTGVGIESERQHALFEPFETLHAAGARLPERSTGLGLAITKRLVEAMGGSITLHSAPGEGTTVTLRLPLPAHGEPAAARAGRLLLVDDDPVSRLLMATMLRSEGYAVDEATDADDALAQWQQREVAAVISDRHMPGADGQALLQRIGEAARGNGRPLPRRLLCTGDSTASATPGQGVDAVLLKPVSVAALRDALVALGVVPQPNPAAQVEVAEVADVAAQALGDNPAHGPR